MLLLRPTIAITVLLAFAATVEPFIILSSSSTPTTGTNTGTTGTVGNLGAIGTITLDTSTLGTGLASLGILGALKLGVIALAAKLAAIAGFALAKKLHYFKEPTEYNTYSEYSDYGHHYMPSYSGGYSGGYGGGGYGAHHYHKRSIDDNDAEEAEEIVLGEEEAFTIVHDSDESRCGERLVCELAQRERRGLATDEESILSLVKRRPTGPSGDGSRRLYMNAIKRGYRRMPCATVYGSCPFTSLQMMAVIRSMGRDLVFETEAFLSLKPDQQTLHPEQNLVLSSSPSLSVSNVQRGKLAKKAITKKETIYRNSNGWSPIITEKKLSVPKEQRKSHRNSKWSPKWLGALKTGLEAPGLQPRYLSGIMTPPQERMHTGKTVKLDSAEQDFIIEEFDHIGYRKQ